MSFASWLNSLWDKIKKFIEDSVYGIVGLLFPKLVKEITDELRSWLTTAVKGLAWVIHKATVAIEEIKFHLSSDIQKFYNTTLGFWVILVGTTLAVAYAPSIVTWAVKKVAATKLYAQILSMVSKVESWKGWTYVNLLVESNRVAEVLFKNWRELWQGIYADVSTIAGDIGLGIGSIASITAATKSLLVTINSTMGADQITAEAAALGRMQQWLASLSNDFNTYANNPQAIWNNLYADVILPQQQYVRNYYSNLITKLNTLSTKVADIEKLPGQFVTLQDSIQKAFGIQMSQSEAKLEKSILKQVNDIIDSVNTNILSKIATIDSELEPLITAIAKHDKNLQSNTSAIQQLSTPPPTLPNNPTTEQLTGFIGGNAAITLGYIISNQAGADIQTFMDYIKKGTDLNMGLITEEQFTEYVNSLGQYGLQVVNPFAV